MPLMGHDATILIADKDQSVVRLLKTVLSNAGHHVVLAQSREEVFEIMEQQDVAVALLDYGVQERQGLEIARKIAQEYPSVKIAMLVYYGASRSGLAACDIGANRFILKPFDDLAPVGRTIKELLLERQSQLTKEQDVTPPILGESTDDEETKVRVIVADTPSGDREELSEALRKLDCEVVEASCAQEALLQLTKEEYDVLIVGYDMGDMTADDVLLRAKRLDNTVAVVVTAMAPTITMTTALIKRGASAFITKPLVDPARTAAAIVRHGIAVLELREELEEEDDEADELEPDDNESTPVPENADSAKKTENVVQADAESENGDEEKNEDADTSEEDGNDAVREDVVVKTTNPDVAKSQ